MAWTQPSTTDWTTGMVVTRTKLNTNLRDNLVFIGDSHAHGSSTGSGAGSRSLGPVTRIDFSTQAAPSTAGRLRRVGLHLQYFGAQLIKITEADAASTEASPRTLGAGSLQAARGTHGHNSASHAVTQRASAGVAEAAVPIDVYGRFQSTAGSTTTIYNFTSTKKISMFYFPVALLQNPVGGTLKVSLLADSVEVDSVTRSTGAPTCGAFAVSGVKVKNTANINWKVKFQNNGSVTKKLFQHSLPAVPSTASGQTAGPSIMEAAADLGSA